MFNGLRQRVAQAIAPVSNNVPSAGYMRGLPGGMNSVMALPMPVLRDSKDDVRQAWGKAAARAVDAMHNNGWIAGTTEAMIALIIGDGLRPNFVPDMSAFNWTEKQTKDWARRAERLFEADAINPHHVDAGGRYTFSQLQASAMRQWFATGEIVGQIPFIKRPGSSTGTKLRLIQSHWLSQRSEPPKIDNGVYVDHHGAPVGYLFDMRDMNGVRREVSKPAFDNWGRTICFHVFDGQPGQVRGITPWAPVLRVLRDYDQLSNATLTAAMIHAIFAATIESDYPSGEVLDALTDGDEQGSSETSSFMSFMEQKVGWSKNVDIDLNRHGKIAQLMVGEKLNLHSSEHPNSAYEPFANFLLREVARCAGALFEDVTGDYRGVTQASMKAAISKQWPQVLYRRKNLAVPPSQRYAEAWIEEKVSDGILEIPGGIDAFLANKAAICRIKWRGPAKPVPDELKAAKTHELYRNMGVMSDEMICNDLGEDNEDVYDARASEKRGRAERGIHGGISNGGSDIDLLDESNDEILPQGRQTEDPDHNE